MSSECEDLHIMSDNDNHYQPDDETSLSIQNQIKTFTCSGTLTVSGSAFINGFESKKPSFADYPIITSKPIIHQQLSVNNHTGIEEDIIIKFTSIDSKIYTIKKSILDSLEPNYITSLATRYIRKDMSITKINDAILLDYMSDQLDQVFAIMLNNKNKSFVDIIDEYCITNPSINAANYMVMCLDNIENKESLKKCLYQVVTKYPPQSGFSKRSNRFFKIENGKANFIKNQTYIFVDIDGWKLIENVDFELSMIGIRFDDSLVMKNDEYYQIPISSKCFDFIIESYYAYYDASNNVTICSNNKFTRDKSIIGNRIFINYSEYSKYALEIKCKCEVFS